MSCADAPSNLTIEGINESNTWQTGPCEWSVNAGATNITLDDVTTCSIYISGANNLQVTNSTIGNCTQTEVANPTCSDTHLAQNNPNTDITFNHDTFENVHAAEANPTVHLQCLSIFGGTNVTVENSTFSECDFFDVFAQYIGTPITNLVLSGNTFGQPTDGPPNYDLRETSVLIDQPVGPTVTVTDNTFTLGAFLVEDNSSPQGFQVSGNNFGVAASNYCQAGVTYTSNTWLSGSCNGG